MRTIALATSLSITLLFVLVSESSARAQTIRSTGEPSSSQVELKPRNYFLQNKKVISNTVISTSKLSNGTVVEERKIVTQSSTGSVETFCLKCFKRPNGSLACHSIECPALRAR